MQARTEYSQHTKMKLEIIMNAKEEDTGRDTAVN